MIQAVLNATPLFWPGVLCSLALAALFARPTARLLRAHRAVGFLLLLALGAIVTLTLLPDIRFSITDNARYNTTGCQLTGGPRPLSELLSPTQSTLNVALFVPLGITAALAGTRRRAAVAGLTAATLPFLIEFLQGELPALGRACDVQDIWDNLFGLLIGLTLGLLTGPWARAAVRRLRRPGTDAA
ncbi:hypothetical protein GCM10009665_44680 [Kitasatospora nipponensis]|uniref:VanZ-like domain-containing protein n=1 Tax=Kitasatospora nipponensis TaxID=258049 RepID=A0ABP4H3A5_9ACTN